MIVKRIIRNLSVCYRDEQRIRSYENLYARMLSQNSQYKQVFNSDSERKWHDRWQPLLKHHKLCPYSYRIFSHLAGESIDRLPLEVCVNVVEPTLNPRNYTAFYDDKNSLPRLMRSEWLPTTYLRSINGHLFSEEGTVIVDGNSVINSIKKERVIVKPSCEQSGRGIQIFRRDNNDRYFNKNHELLSIEFLKQHWKDNWLIQECLNQSEELSQFNPSSINTIRIATYRSLGGTIRP